MRGNVKIFYSDMLKSLWKNVFLSDNNSADDDLKTNYKMKPLIFNVLLKYDFHFLLRIHCYPFMKIQ